MMTDPATSADVAFWALLIMSSLTKSSLWGLIYLCMAVGLIILGVVL